MYYGKILRIDRMSERKKREQGKKWRVARKYSDKKFEDKVEKTPIVQSENLITVQKKMAKTNISNQEIK